MISYKGTVFSEGIAMGKLHLISQMHAFNLPSVKSTELEKLKEGLRITIAELKEFLLKNKENQDYLNFQILLLQDPVLLDEAEVYLNQGDSAIHSITKVLEAHQLQLKESSSFYLQQRVVDFSDIEQRIVRNITGNPYLTLNEKFILYAEDLLPSYLIQNKENVLGVITRMGGDSTHGAILCRQLNIPYIVASIQAKEGETVVLDTRKQQIMLNPNTKTMLHYGKIIQELSEETYVSIAHPEYKFLANVSSNLELDKVLKYGFDGVGLYRTEMIFMNVNHPLSLEEQFEIYKEAIEKMKEKPICFRTFDIGDDKQLSYVQASKKGLENYIKNQDLFVTQIKALLMANHYNSLKIMFPMISNLEEYLYLKDWVYAIQAEIKNKSKFELGIMLETSSALESIHDFKDVDFVSIGTNDLVLDIYHIHRNLQAKEMKSYLNDLLTKLKEVVIFCKEHQIELSICGELAAITTALKKFMKIGFKNFSVAAPAIKVLNKIYKEIVA